MPLRVIPFLLVCFAFGPGSAWGASSLLLPAPDSSSKWGYVDSLSGKTVIEPRYSRAGMFNGGFAVVHMSFLDASYSVLGTYGKLATVLPQGDGIIDAEGNEILPPVNGQHVIPASSHGESRPGQGRLLPLYEVQNDYGRGVLDAEEGWILPLGENESIRFFPDGSLTFNETGYISAWPERDIHFAPNGYLIAEVSLEMRLFALEDKDRVAHRSGYSDKKGFMAVSNWSGRMVSNTLYDDILFAGCRRWAGLTLTGRLDIFNQDGGVARSIGTSDAPHILESGEIIYRRNRIRYILDICTLESVPKVDYTWPKPTVEPELERDFRVVFREHKAMLLDAWNNERIPPLYELLLPAGRGYWWGRYDRDRWILIDSVTGKEIRIKDDEKSNQ